MTQHGIRYNKHGYIIKLNSKEYGSYFSNNISFKKMKYIHKALLHLSNHTLAEISKDCRWGYLNSLEWINHPYETNIDTEHLRYPTNLTAYLSDKTSLNLILKKGIST